MAPEFAGRTTEVGSVTSECGTRRLRPGPDFPTALRDATFLSPADFDADGDVDTNDSFAFLAAYDDAVTNGQDPANSGYDPRVDLTGDGAANSNDFFRYYAVFGQGTPMPGAISIATGPDNPIGYAGYVFNPENNQYCVRHRTYDPEHGRWLERDPLRAMSGSLNFYEYCLSRASVLIDPLGLDPNDHPIPLALGGSPDKQLCFDSSTYSLNTHNPHNQRHRCLAKLLTGSDKLDWKLMAEAFGNLDDEGRRAVIRRSLISAGVDPKVLTQETMDAIFVDCTPGESRTGQRRRYPAVMRADGSFAKG